MLCCRHRANSQNCVPTFFRRMLQFLKASSQGTCAVKGVKGKWAEPIVCLSTRTTHHLKNLAEMPGPSAISFAWDLFARKGLSQLHELQLEGRKRYGPIWKAKFGPILTVHVAEPTLIEQVLRQEGQYPMRSDLSSWKDYRHLRGHGYGLLTAEREEWQEVRSLLGKHTLRPKAVEAYDGTLNSVVTDLLASLKRQRDQNVHGLITDIADEFYRFGLEGISSVLFESRIGCLESQVPKETKCFIESINTMFVMTLLTMAMPVWMKRMFPKPWDTFCQCWDYIFHFAKGHIDQRLKEESDRLAQGQEVKGQYLTYFLLRQGLSMKDIYSNVTELLLAGVDTVRLIFTFSSTLSWCLYELSRHPEIQTAMRNEVLMVLGGKQIPGAPEVAQMQLMKAVVKEVLRLYPVIPGNARVIPDSDIQIGGYLIPQKTLITLCHYATSRDASFFSNPNEFHPERWLTKEQRHHPFASLPFGVGKRSCIGRRIAQLELHLALARILLQYEVRPDPDGAVVSPMTRTVLVPKRAINLQFIEL
ncbi:25-hydroxyvitamin D-1 alpha hydroxylase, mitochondrial-like [Arapaima gigas]